MPNTELTVERLADEVANGEIDTVIVGFADLYGRLIGKRCDASFFLDQVVDHGGHACDYLFGINMEMEPVPGYRFSSWEQGYGDVGVRPDLGTLRRAAWTDRTAIVLADTFVINSGTIDSGAINSGISDSEINDSPIDDAQPVAISPRHILSIQEGRLIERGLHVEVASELEFYLYRDSYRQAQRRRYHQMRPAGWYSEDYDLLQGGRHEPFMATVRRALAASGIPVENSKGETGVGQHELNVRYARAGEMADRHVIMKHAMKQIADDQGISVTFMAKPVSDDAGSSCHIHLSLWDGDSNVFSGHSDRFRWFLGGWMRHVDDFMVCYAPTVNSYKRYVDGSWAPTRLAWATDNRTVGFRVVGQGPSLRIECRIPGADVNPYLAFAASIASGLAGLDAQIEPPDEFAGDGYSAVDAPTVPASLQAAVERFDASALARSAFGDEVVDHYTHFYRNEVAEFSRSVTDWERRRYFERI